MKYEFIHTHRSTFTVGRMCRNLSVSRSGYYNWRKCRPGKRKRENRLLKLHVKATFKRHKGLYGSPRLTRELQKEGIACSINRVARIMRCEGLRARTKRKFKATTDSKHNLPVAPNLVNQQFHAAGPNRLWTSDITFIRTREGWLYLAVILDVFSRQIVGWALDKQMPKELVLHALGQAVKSRRVKPGLIFHSDRGSQYASNAVRRFLATYKMKQSMSRKGDCYDNAITESFFKTLKMELIYTRKTFQTRWEARQQIFNYIEGYYNRFRQHSSIGYMAPAEFEKLHDAA
jgi:transposase InsO family protein